MAESRAAIVYLHGLWLRGPEAFPLRRQLLATGRYDWHNFPWLSTLRSPAAHADRLDEFARALPATTVHFVAHSLGGVILQRCFQRHPRQKPGRVVLLGTPSQPSRAAQVLARVAPGKLLLGRVATAELLADQHRQWDHANELGVIAGTQAIGLGRLLTRFDGPNDGTVSVAETQLPGARARLILPVSHMKLIWSPEVARQVDAFLQTGAFAQLPSSEMRRVSGAQG